MSDTQAAATNNPNAGKPDNTATATNEENRALFQTGQVYKGVIQSVQHGDGIYHVTLQGNSSYAQACEWGVGLLTNAFLGFKTSALPTVGTGVYVLGGNPPTIIGTFAVDPRDDNSGNKKTTTGTEVDTDDMKLGDTGKGKRHTVPSDMVEGEFEIASGLGPALKFALNLMALKGSDRAKVETHLLNDMVRVVSDTYKHMSAFGDYQIYNDGGLNVVFEGTSREHEAAGLLDVDEEKVSVTDNEVAFTSDLVANGRNRFSEYIGFLGDFVHQFVTDPTTTASSIGDGLRPGKSRVWHGSDGTMLMQSVTEIALERVVRIPVPQEKKRWDDPEGVLKTAWDSMLEAQKAFKTVWNYGDDYRNIHHAAYQLREYARWLSCYHSYSRFHQYDAAGEEWRIPREDEIDHEWTNKEKDVEGADNGHISGVYDTYACIRIMRDGAIVLWDGYGSSITMSRRCVHISAPRHIDLDAAGDIRLTAGNDIYIKARRNLELSAVVGSLIAKSRTAWKALCEWGSIWLKSDAKDPNEPGYSAESPDDASEDPEPEVLDAAIFLDATQGKTTINSHRTITIQTDALGSADSTDVTDSSKSIVLQSRLQDVKTIASRSLQMKAFGNDDGFISMDTPRSIVGISKNFIVDSSTFDIGKRFTISSYGAVLNANVIKCEYVASQGPIYGAEALDDVTTGTGCCYVPHSNHILISEQDQAPEFADSDDIEDLTAYKAVRNDVSYDEPFASYPPTWTYYSEVLKYPWLYIATNPAENQEEQLFVPLAQQRIEFDSDISGQYKEWTLSSSVLKSAPRTLAADAPFPGPFGAEYEHSSAIEPLHKIFTGEYKNQTPAIKTDLTFRTYSRQFLKTSTNKS